MKRRLFYFPLRERLRIMGAYVPYKKEKEMLNMAKGKTKVKQPGGRWQLTILSGISNYMIIAIMSNLTYALTDSFGMAVLLVTGVIAVSKVFDGVSDIIAGVIIDRTKSRFGKARVYDLMIIPQWIAAFLCFNIPDLGTIGEVIWLFIMYNMYSTVFYTLQTVAGPLRMKRSFRNDVLAKAAAGSGVAGTACSVAMGVALPILIERFEAVPGGWNIILIVCAVPSLLLGITQFLLLPEMEQPEEELPASKTSPVRDLVQGVKDMLNNRQIFLVLIMLVSNTFILNIASGVNNYFYKYVYGDLSFASAVSLCTLVGYISLLFMPTLQKKFGNRNLMMISFAMMLAGSLIKYINFTSAIILIIGSTLVGIGGAFVSTMYTLLVIDCMEYGQYVNKGSHSQAIYSSVTGFGNKIALGLVSIGIGAVLAVGGYDASLTVQPASALTAIELLFAGLPALFSVAGLVALKFYDLDKRLEKIRAEQNAQN